MSALLEAIRRIEKACICGEEIGTTAFGPTGEEYRIVYAGGLGDGEGHPALYRTPDLAAMAWEASVRKYAATVRGATLDALCAGADRDEYDCFEPDQREDGSRTVRNTRHLYWHIRPEIVEATVLVPSVLHPGEQDKSTWYAVYSRLLISDRRAKEAA